MCFYLRLVLSAFIARALGHLGTPFVACRSGNWESNRESLDHVSTAGTTMDLYILPKSNRENALIDTLYDVGDFMHPILRRCRYGAYLSRKQVAKLVTPRVTQTCWSLSTPGWETMTYSPDFSCASATHGGNRPTVIGVPMPRPNVLLSTSYQLYLPSR